MPKIDSYRDLVVWQKAMEAAESCFRLTATLPREMRFELTSQIHRSAISIPSNIAEGFSRRGRSTYLNHLRIGLGSTAELETQLELAMRLRLIERRSVQSVLSMLDEVGRMLTGLMKSLERSA